MENTVVCLGGVEIWLNSLLEVMQLTMQTILGRVADSLSSSDYDFISDFHYMPGQVSELSLQTSYFLVFGFDANILF